MTAPAAGASALRFYTKPDCPLCDKAWPVAVELAERFGLELVRVDIRSDPVLVQRHGERIPVLALAQGQTERELGWGLLSERALAKRLAEQVPRA